MVLIFNTKGTRPWRLGNKETNMSLYNELSQRGLLEVPNEDAATAIKAIAATDILVPDATTWMRHELLWYWSAPDVMSGSIQAGLDDGTLVDLAEALGELWSSLFGQSAAALRTNTSTEIAGRIYSGFNGLVFAGVATTDQMNEFYELGGGLMFPNCTAADVQEAKDLEAERIALEQAEQERIEREFALRSKWDDAMITAGAEEAFYQGDEAALIVAINSAVSTMG